MVWNEAVQFYNHTFENADPRVADWPLMHSPFPTLFICLSYVYVVKSLGPRLMKNREPLDIRWIMAAYNFIMVIFSFIVFYYFGVYGWFGSYSWKCQPVDYSNNPQAIGMASTCWWFYISKFIEFSDTIFFVMRKKYSQVSTLHVVHHGIMPMSVWLGLKFTPGGHSTFFAFVNSFVHVLMYIYYGLAAFGPHMTKYLWWKKYMTTIQMIQFIMIFTHAFQLIFVNCNYPRGFMYWIGFHAVLFWFLFADFYNKAYHKKKVHSKELKNTETKKIATKNGYQLSNGHSYSNAYTNGTTNVGTGTSNEYKLSNGNGYKNGYSNGTLEPQSNSIVDSYSNGIDLLSNCKIDSHLNGVIDSHTNATLGDDSKKNKLMYILSFIKE